MSEANDDTQEMYEQAANYVPESARNGGEVMRVMWKGESNEGR